MWTRMIMVLVMAILAGCSTLDRMKLSEFEPISADASYQYFKYTVTANEVSQPFASENSERERMAWLEDWLQENGMAGKKYEVVSRRPVMKGPSIFGQVYSIFYEVKVQR